jgi:hypothetical protein
MQIIHSGRNPYAIFLLLACALTGVAGLISPQRTSPAVANVLLPWELEAWYGGLILSSGAALGGLLWRGLTSLLVERVALVVLASVTAMYSVAVVLRGGVALSLAATATAGLCVASVVRIWQIGRDLKVLRRPQGGR